MPRSSVRWSLSILVSFIVIGSGGAAMAGSDQEAIAARLVEVGLTIERQIELAQHNDERGTLDEATLERHAEAAKKAVESLERRIHSLPDGTTDELQNKLHAVQVQAANLVRAAELGTAPPRRQSATTQAKHLNRRGGGKQTIPANDDCDDAFVAGLGAFAGETIEATNDGEAVCGASLTSPDVWYRFVAPAHGHVVAETRYSMYDTVLSVHSECPGTMRNQIACNDDSVGTSSKVEFHVWQGDEYLVRVSGSNGATGIYQLAFSYGGAIEGTVTDAQAGAPVTTWIAVFDIDGFQAGSAGTDASGFYSAGGLGTDDFFVATNGSDETVDELYDNLPCPGGPFNGCDPTTGDPVAVTIGNVTSGIDFVLDRNGVISGTVTDEHTALGIDDVAVTLYDDSGSYVERDYTDASGEYRFTGLPAENYYLWATVTTHLPELYDDVLCLGGPNQGCAFTDGTQVVAQLNGTTSGIDFQLERLGGIAGTVVDRSTALPLSWFDVDVFDQSGSWVKDGRTQQDGSFEISGLPDGTYFVTASKYSGWVPQLYNGMDCPPAGCEVLTGTPVVIAGLAVTIGVDFGLIEQGKIEGQVLDESTASPIQGIRVRVYDGAGVYVGRNNTNSLGGYVVDELDAGTYFLIADDGDYHNELYDNLPCPDSCDPTTGTPVAVADGTASSGVDFSLVPKGIITGTVTAENGGSPVNMMVGLYDHTGELVRSDDSRYGVYRVSGVDDGQYFVAALKVYGSDPYLDELYDDIPCWGGPPDGCAVTDGTPVTAASGSTTAGIDFSLLRSGFIEGVVTDAVSQAPIENGGAVVMEVSPPGTWYDWESLASDGSYRFDGLLPGDYVVAVDVYDHRDEVWSELPCHSEYPDGCDLPGGTPITITVASEIEGIDFTVDRLGEVSGTVRSASTGLPLGIRVAVFDDQGEYLTGFGSDERGEFRFGRLWPGTYFAATEQQHVGFVDQLYQGIECPLGPFDGCDPTTGTPLAVGFNSTIRWVDFDLAPTGAISGRVTDGLTSLPLEGVHVGAWDESGNQRSSDWTDALGAFSLVGLNGGTFFVATKEFGSYDPDYIDQLFVGIPCPGGPLGGCDPTKGTPVTVVGGSTTESIDLALPRRLGGIAGTVSGLPSGEPVSGVRIDVWNANHVEYEAGALTNSAGTYLIDLDPGTYVVATDNPGSWVNQIFDGIICPVGSAYTGDCDPMTGDLVTVTGDELSASINFVLEVSPALFGDSFESGSTIRWDVTMP